LIANVQAKRVVVRIVDWHLDIQHLVVHLDIAEILVLLGFSWRQCWLF
jgi:hypothetical protein